MFRVLGVVGGLGLGPRLFWGVLGFKRVGVAGFWI